MYTTIDSDPDIDITVSTGTPVLTCYLGPGLVGIIFEKAN